jgi:RND family efflux transporter MFP subunit
LTPKIAGRVIFLQVREGDRVEPGQVLARTEASDLEAEMRSAEAAAAQARARVLEARQAERPTNVALTSEIRRQQALVGTAKAQQTQARADYDTKIASAEATVTDAEGRIRAADANIAAAEAAIASAEANLANARTRLDRQEALYREGAVAKQLLDDAQTTVDINIAALGQAKQQRQAAVAARESAVAQKRAAEKQVAVIRNEAQANISVAGAAVVQAQAGLEAARANTGRAPAYESNIAALEAAARAAEATYRAAQARVNATILRSPLSGVVSRRYLDPGAVASPTQPVIAVQEMRTLWVTIGVPEEISRRVRIGQTATVRLDALPGRTFTGLIERIEPAADPQSRQFTARVRLDNSQGRLRPGTFAEVRLVTQKVVNAVVVPREAVLQPRNPEEKSTVAVITGQGEGQTVEIRPVQTGLTDGANVVIEQGLQEGESVVILTGRTLKDGQAVKVAPTKGEGGEAVREAPTSASPQSNTVSPPPLPARERGLGGEGVSKEGTR